MKVTAKEEAGLMLLAHLAQATDKGPVSLAQISEDSQITLSYLEKVVPALRKAGLVNAERGANGGYSLSRKPEAITVADALRALNGDILSTQCVGHGDKPCPKVGNCPVHTVWDTLYDRIEDTLKQITLKDLT
jgi:Rrf2 family iron-sulfur cluster assembly transcriptional regulator